MNQTAPVRAYNYSACDFSSYLSTGLKFVGLEASLLGHYQVGLPSFLLGRTIKAVSDVNCYQYTLQQALTNDLIADVFDSVSVFISYYIKRLNLNKKTGVTIPLKKEDDFEIDPKYLQEKDSNLKSLVHRRFTGQTRRIKKRAAHSTQVHNQAIHAQRQALAPKLKTVLEAPYCSIELEKEVPNKLLEKVKEAGKSLLQVSLIAKPFYELSERYNSLLYPLHQAVIDQDLAYLTRLYQSGLDINAVDNHGDNLFHIATITQNLEMFQALIRWGVNINTQNRGGNTPLHIAATTQSLEEVQMLIEAGADVHILNEFKASALHCAASGKVDIIKELLKAGSPVNAQNMDGMSPLHMAVYKKSLQAARELMVAGADLNLKDNQGAAALHLACSVEDNSKVVEELIQAGAEINPRTKDGETPFHFAIATNDQASIDLLIAAKADIEAKDKAGNAPLLGAVGFGNQALIRTLIQAGASTEVKTETRHPLLHLAVVKQGLGVVRLLIEAQVNPNGKSPDGNTALHQAVIHGSLDVVQELIRAGGDVNAVNKRGASVLSYMLTSRQKRAYDSTEREMIKAELIEAGAKKHPPKKMPVVQQFDSKRG